MDVRKNAPYLALLLIVIGGVVLSALTVLGPNAELSGTDDFINLNNSDIILHYGFGPAHLPVTTFSTAYFFEGVPALFMDLFGANIVTESSLGILSLVGATITVFLIAKTQKDYLAGLLAALTFVLIPIVASEGATPGDSMPVAFLTSLAVLMLLLGIKKNDGKYYLLSGFIGLAGVLFGSAEMLFVFVFLLPALAYLLWSNRNKDQLKNTLLFFSGILIAAAFMLLLGYLLQSNPTVYFANNFYHYPGSPEPQVVYVLSEILPTNQVYLNDTAHFSLFDFASVLRTERVLYLFGLFGYLALLGALYLIAKRRKYAAIPLAWLLLMVLYLSFGKSNPLYAEFLLIRLRFMTIVAPPMAVVIGLAMGDFVQERMAAMGEKRFVSYALLSLMLLVYVFVAVGAVGTMTLMHKVVLLDVYPWVETANLLVSLHPGIPIYLVSGLSQIPGSSGFNTKNIYGAKTVVEYLKTVNQVDWLAIEVYAGFKTNIDYTDIFANCSDIGSGYFIELNSSPPTYPNGLLQCGSLKTVASLDPRQAVLGSEGALITYPKANNILENVTLP